MVEYDAEGDVLAQRVILRRGSEQHAQVELLREIVETPGDRLALEGVEGEVASASVVLHCIVRYWSQSKGRTHLICHTIRVEVASVESNIFLRSLVVKLRACGCALGGS